MLVLEWLKIKSKEYPFWLTINQLTRRDKMSVAYEKDIVAWANEQASFIRAGRFDLLYLEHIAEEIEDVGKSEQRELLGN